MIYLKQSTAKTLRFGPFLDDTDGKTPETGLTIAQADIRLSKGGGAFAQTNGAGGATHDELGWYSLELDDTDTNTLGPLQVSIQISGALPVWAEFNVLPANSFDSFIAGSDVLNANVYSINSNTNSAIYLQSYIPRIDDNVSSRSIPGSQMDLVDAPNATAITAIQDGLSTFDPANDLVVKANVYQINSNTNSAVLLQSYIPRLDVNVSNTVNANIIKVSGTAVEIASVFNANVYQINGNTDAAIYLQSYIPRLNDNIDSRSTFDPATDLVVKANVYQINSNTNSAVLLQSYIPRLDENVSSRSVPGSQMDLVNAPNATAITAIQNGLSTFDSTTDTVNANVYQINANTNAAILLQSYIPRLDDNVSSRSVPGSQMDLIDAPNATAITAIQDGLSTFDYTTDTVIADIVSVQTVAVTNVDDFKADVSGLSTFDSTTDTVNANVYQINANTNAAVLLQSYIPRLDENVSGIEATVSGVVNANVYSINGNTDAAILLQSYIPRLDTNISSVSTTFDGVVNANVYSINGNTDAAVLLQSYIPRLDDNVSAEDSGVTQVQPAGDTGPWSTDSTIVMNWFTFGANGASLARSTDGTIKIYKDGSTTERTSASGITDTKNFDSIVGANQLTVDTADNDDAGFFVVDSIYNVWISGAVIDGRTVSSWIGSFSLVTNYYGEIISS